MGLILGSAGIALMYVPPVATLETVGLDLLFLMRGAHEPPSGVCVVAVDDISYDVLGIPASGALPRGIYARLIRTLEREGAGAVALDVSFKDASSEPEDRALAEAIADSGRVVLGSEINLTRDSHASIVTVIEPYEPFGRAAAAVATVGFPQDRDGVIRRTWLRFRESDDRERPSLALAAHQVATGDRSGMAGTARMIDYYGPARTVPTVSLYQALEPHGHLPSGFFRGRTVFVGLSQPAAPGEASKDTFLTPFRGGNQPPTYGVEIHATVAANLLEGRRIDRPHPAVEAVLLMLLPLLATFAFVYLRPVMGAACLVVMALAPWSAGHLAFSRAHLWIPVMIPFVVQIPGAYVLSLVWYYMTTVRERERIQRAFSFYLSPEMIRRIVADPASLNLGGEEIIGTVLFTDIKDFTTLSESLRPPQTVALLNTYFSEVNHRIFAEGGTLIKFIGDAVFAIWGAPVRNEDHAFHACAAGLALARAQDPRSDGDDTALASLTTRIGVNTGSMVVGNLGSEQRFDYTAIGDAVNVAARLEGLNKYLGTRVIASGTTVLLTRDRFVVRRLGLARVAGRAEPVEIFEILGRQGEATVPDAAAMARFATAVRDYTAGRFEEAASGFREVRTMCGGEDGPSAFYLKTIERFLREPPPAGWEGFMPFESK